MPGFDIRTVKISNEKYFLAFKHLKKKFSKFTFYKKGKKKKYKSNLNQNLNKCSDFIAFESLPKKKNVDSSDWYTKQYPCGDRDPTANTHIHEIHTRVATTIKWQPLWIGES